MQTFPRTLPFAIHSGALDAALRAVLGSKMIGLSTYGANPAISVFLDAGAVAADVTAMDSVIAAHDPVFLSVDKTTIAANNTDSATITVSVPRVNAAPVTLLVAGSPVSVAVTAGVGTIQVQTATPSNIPIQVQAPTNRTTDSLQVQGI